MTEKKVDGSRNYQREAWEKVEELILEQIGVYQLGTEKVVVMDDENEYF